MENAQIIWHLGKCRGPNAICTLVDNLLAFVNYNRQYQENLILMYNYLFRYEPVREKVVQLMVAGVHGVPGHTAPRVVAVEFDGGHASATIHHHSLAALPAYPTEETAKLSNVRKILAQVRQFSGYSFASYLLLPLQTVVNKVKVMQTGEISGLKVDFKRFQYFFLQIGKLIEA